MAGMFSPEMMKMAQEQMAKMSPEQIQAMQRQVRAALARRVGKRALIQAAIVAAPRRARGPRAPAARAAQRCLPAARCTDLTVVCWW
jgi:hypothetical protein